MPTFAYPDDFTGTNWKITDGDVYVSKSGDNTTGDGSPQAPFLTMQKAVSSLTSSWKKVVVGTGFYDERVSKSTFPIFMFADGDVLMSGVLGTTLGANQPFVMHISSVINGFRIEDYEVTTLLNYHNCYFKNIENGTYGLVLNKYNTFVNSTIVSTSSAGGMLIHNTFINCSFGSGLRPTVMRDNLFDIDCENVVINRAVLLESDYNIFESNVINGVDIDAYKAAGGTDPNSFVADPKFNDKSKEDFTLALDSPALGAASDGFAIGAWNSANSYDGADSVFSGASLDNVAIDPDTNNMGLINDTQVGIITTTKIDLGELKAPMGRVLLFGESDFPNGVVDSLTGDGNENPNQLTFEMRYSPDPLPDDPADAGDPRPYATFVWNKIPTVDASGRGNGDPAFVITEEQAINAQHVQMRITIRPDGTGN